MANAWARDRARTFYLAFGAMAVAAVLIGFSTTYFISGPRGSLNIPWLVHVHGWTAMSWVGLLVAQVILVRSGRSRLHRQMGKLAIPLALSVWGSGIAVGVWVVERDLPGQGDSAYESLSGTIISLTMFLALAIAAVLLRRKPDWHKRLMVLATIVVLWPAFFRFRHLMPFVPRPDLLLGLLLADLPILIAAVRDRLRWGRVHPAWAFVGSAVFVEQAVETLAFGSGFTTPLGRALYALLA
jgi:uncharacterized membrane protein YozB (DUF420 family)